MDKHSNTHTHSHTHTHMHTHTHTHTYTHTHTHRWWLLYTRCPGTWWQRCCKWNLIYNGMGLEFKNESRFGFRRVHRRMTRRERERECTEWVENQRETEMRERQNQRERENWVSMREGKLSIKARETTRHNLRVRPCVCQYVTLEWSVVYVNPSRPTHMSEWCTSGAMQ